MNIILKYKVLLGEHPWLGKKCFGIRCCVSGCWCNKKF